MSELIRKQDAIDTLEGVDWYHINRNGELVKGANSQEDEPLYKAKDVYEALENVKPVAQCLPNACTDAISRQDAINAPVRMVSEGIEWIPVYHIENLPSAQPEIIRCKDCKHFHYDMPYVIQGIPVLGHEVCDFWGDGCKTSENGFCSFAEE